jgi:Mrp family chromosome partitioning ATPase
MEHLWDDAIMRRSAGSRETPPVQTGSANLQGLIESINARPSLRPGGKIVLFSSTHPGEGKTTVVSELVHYVCARQQQTVAVIDGGQNHDLSKRLPSGALRDFSYLVSSGATSDKPRGLLSRLTVVQLNPDILGGNPAILGPQNVRLLGDMFDYVFIEMPALSDAPYATLHAQHLDGVVLIIECGRTRWPAIQDARVRLERAGASVIGAFLNKRTFVIPKKIYQSL